MHVPSTDGDDCESGPMSVPRGFSETFRLEPGDVDVWLAPIDTRSNSIADLGSVLSADEIERARRFVFEADRQRFLLSHVLVRVLLSRYTAVPVTHIRITRAVSGKPMLLDAVGLDFNMAHSGELAAYAIALQRQVGIDVERVRADLNIESLVDRYFTPFEAQAIRRGAEDPTTTFFSYWVRKEAVLKATGHALRFPLRSVDVARGASTSGEVFTHVPSWAIPDWRIMDVPAGPAYRAAVAVDAAPRRLRCRRISAEFVCAIVEAARTGRSLGRDLFT
jgi:4'-phosphopantetheinyl transferase